jgi:hypothetical protein
MFDMLGGLFGGQEPETKTYNTTGPRDPYVDDFFLKIYGADGTFDPQQQATLFNDRMNGLYDYASNAQPTIAKIGGQEFKIMSPIRNRVAMLNALNDAQMKRSYDPFLGMTNIMEQSRHGSVNAYPVAGQQGLLGSLAPALGMWAGAGFPGMGGSGGGGSAGGGDYGGWDLY